MLRKRSAHRAKIFLKYCFSKKMDNPIFLITTRRSGSNFLLGLLNSVPGVSFASEVLHPDMFYGIRRSLITRNSVLRHIAHSVNACKGRVRGAKLLFIHMRDHRLGLEDLQKRFPRARFILLYRRSMLEQYLSLKIAEATGLWQVTGDTSSSSVSLRIDAEELKRFCLKTKVGYEKLLQNAWLAKQPLILDYETLSADPQGVFDKIVFPWLGLPSSPVSSPSRKRKEDRSQFILNYEEIMRLSGAPWTLQDYS